MNWIAQNESPAGFEPVFSVIEKTTGRDIAVGLEEDEALKIANCEEAFYLIKDLVEVLDELYVNTNIKDEHFLSYASKLIADSQKLLIKAKV